MSTTLQEAIKLVEELEDETSQLVAEPDAMGMGGDDIGSAVASPDLPPSEPPISDTALGSDTEGETALDLLRQMRDSLQQLSAALAPPPEEMGAGDIPPEGAAGALPPAEGEAEGAEGGEGAGDDFGVPEPEDDEGAEEPEGGEEEDEPSDSRPVDEK